MSEDKLARNFATKRLQAWRASELERSFTSTLDHIEEFGWECLSVKGDSVAPRFSYTIGLFDTAGLPELVQVGLTEKTGHIALDEAAKLLRHGADLTKGRFREVVGDIEVVFRPIDSKWLHHIMLRTDWYYKGAYVPALQLIYPDLENRFQWEDGFTEYFRQPLLQADAEQGLREKDLWAAYDENSSLSRWKFPDLPHTKVFLSQTVHDKKEVVTYVAHELFDGAWQFLGDKMADGGGPVISCFHHPIDDDPSLQELADLPLGWYAVRDSPGAPWQRFESEREKEGGTPTPQ